MRAGRSRCFASATRRSTLGRQSRPRWRRPLDEGLIDYVDMSRYGDDAPDNPYASANVIAHPVLRIGQGARRRAGDRRTRDQRSSTASPFSGSCMPRDRRRFWKAIFHTSGCAACHRPHFVTQGQLGESALAGQPIWPYSDLLRHDMGPDLADGLAEGDASGQEWRTPPLWGLGLVQTVNPRAGFLHDGRARTVLEAILWHGGEATAARTAVTALSAPDREHLLAFLTSL